MNDRDEQNKRDIQAILLWLGLTLLKLLPVLAIIAVTVWLILSGHGIDIFG
ncbi:MAG: hypothetical protein J6K92_00515 [Oscillospiraceae bacterium]|nr:hypothetical protein [Oscillospiraceae bacterium]